MYSLHRSRETTNLDGTWSYAIEKDTPGEELGYPSSSFEASDWRPIELPDNWYRTEIGDLYGTVWFRRSFATPSKGLSDRVFLRFAGVDYLADVWLNDTYLGHHEGMFNPFDFDVTDVLDPSGQNVLVVRNAAPRSTSERIHNRGFLEETWLGEMPTPVSHEYQWYGTVAVEQIKGHMIDAMHRPGGQSGFRGDGSTGGIWDSVELVVKPAVFVSQLKASTRIGMKKDWLGDGTDKRDGTALVAFDVTVTNTTGAVVRTRLGAALHGHNFEDDGPIGRSREVTLAPGTTMLKLTVTIPKVRLWWTWDHGDPHLYRAVVTVAEDSVTELIGVKELRHDAETGQWTLNDRRIFLRGMRYISSQWMSEAKPEIWDDDLDRMRELGINAVRIGSHVEKDGFYSSCDERGILVWQVFPLHYCVSDSDDFIDRASDMIRDMGLMLHNHASLGMWSVFKEPEVYGFAERPNNYFRLCRILQETLASVDPVRWIHLGDYREGVQNFMPGLLKPADINVREIPLKPNIVEFGGHSVPVLESLKEIIPADKLWPPDWDTWEYNCLYYDLMFGFMKMELGNSVEEFIDNTQTYEALVSKEQLEWLRRRKYEPIASTFLYYWNDPCPVIGSGVFDYFRRPYKLYESLKLVYTPVLVGIERTDEHYEVGRPKWYAPGSQFGASVWVVSDRPEPISGARVDWRLVSRDTGDVIDSGHQVCDLDADSVTEVDDIDWAIPDNVAVGGYRVELEVVHDGQTLSRNHTDIEVGERVLAP